MKIIFSCSPTPSTWTSTVPVTELLWSLPGTQDRLTFLGLFSSVIITVFGASGTSATQTYTQQHEMLSSYLSIQILKHLEDLNMKTTSNPQCSTQIIYITDFSKKVWSIMNDILNNTAYPSYPARWEVKWRCPDPRWFWQCTCTFPDRSGSHSWSAACRRPQRIWTYKHIH